MKMSIRVYNHIYDSIMYFWFSSRWY